MQSSSSELKLYHEKQRYWLCGQHCLNNLLQKHCFRQDQLNNIQNQINCQQNQSTWINRFGLGDYDFNLIDFALSQEQYQLIWYNNKIELDDFKIEDKNIWETPEVKGIIINKIIKGYFKNSRHWFTIYRHNNDWYNLDSKLDQYQKFESKEELLLFLQNILQNDGKIMFAIKI